MYLVDSHIKVVVPHPHIHTVQVTGSSLKKIAHYFMSPIKTGNTMRTVEARHASSNLTQSIFSTESEKCVMGDPKMSFSDQFEVKEDLGK